MNKWIVEYASSERSASGEEEWLIGYIDEEMFLPVGKVWEEYWARKIVKSLEFYETAMDLPEFTRLPVLDPVFPPTKKKTRKTT